MKLNLLQLKAAILCLGLLPVTGVAYGQEKLVESYKASIWFGIRNVTRDSFPTAENLDFLNYLVSEKGISDYQYIGLSAHFWLIGNWEADIKVAMYDDFLPNNFNFSAQYFPFKKVGFTAGIYSYPQLMDEFNMFHKLTDVGYYGDIETNYRQRYVYETGIIAGPVFIVDYHSFHAVIKLNGGVSSMSTFSEVVKQKQINTNLRREIHYQTKSSPALLFFPEAEMNLDLIKGEKSTFGIQLQTSWYTVKRSIDYTRTTYTWVYDNPLTEEISNPKHRFNKFELDLGVFLKW